MDEKIEILDPHFRPKWGKLTALSLQHVFAMFSATILVPILTGLPISLGLLTSGIGTLLYILCSKRKVPMYLGSSFAYIAYIQNTKSQYQGLGPVLTGVVAIGLVYLLVALIIKYAGIKWIDKIFPSVVVGPIIIIIGLSISHIAIEYAGLKSVSEISALKESWKTIVVALTTMLIAAILSIRAKGFLKVIPFLIAILGGYIVALSVNWLPYGDSIIDFTPLLNTATNPSQWFALPPITLLGWKDQELFWGFSMAKIDFRAVIVVIPLTFATICEHIGGHQVLGKITGHDYITDPGLHRTIAGDGIASIAAGALGSVPNTSYGENIAVIGMTKTASVWVTGGAAVIAILLSFVNIFAAALNTIPNAIIGGICLILYGFIAINGIKILKNVDLDNSRNVIIISVMLVSGLGGALFLGLSSMAMASTLGIILNLVLPHPKKEDNKI